MFSGELVRLSSKQGLFLYLKRRFEIPKTASTLEILHILKFFYGPQDVRVYVCGGWRGWWTRVWSWSVEKKKRAQREVHFQNQFCLFVLITRVILYCTDIIKTNTGPLCRS